MSSPNKAEAGKKGGEAKEIKRQESMEELPEEQVPPPPRTAVMLLEAYPEKMIMIHEEKERKAKEEIEKEAKRIQEEEERKKKEKMGGSQVANKSNANKSQAPAGGPEDPNKKRKDSADIKHLENSELHFGYTQKGFVLHIDTSKSVNEIQNMIDDATHKPHGVHISFWLYFEQIKFDHPKNYIQFLSFGKNASNRSLTFSIEKTEVPTGEGKPPKFRNDFIVQYIGQNTKKVSRIVAESNILANKLYFVTFSVIPSPDGFTELRLAINSKIQASQSANEGIVIHPHHLIVGSEVTSSPFKGLLTDLIILAIPFTIQDQKSFYENYWDYPNGSRGRELLDDQIIHAKINERYTITGCPKNLLKSYKYDETFKRTIQDKRNVKEVVETEEEIKAKTDKWKAAKLERERTQKRIKADVNNFIKDLADFKPEHFEILKTFVHSRKWIFKSWNLFSPTIKKPNDPKLPFDCIHSILSKKADLQCPFYAIETEHFYRVLGKVVELDNEIKRVLLKFGDITESIYNFIQTVEKPGKEGSKPKFEKREIVYISYDKWLHYLCWADLLRPPGWVEKVEEENEEEEEEDMSSSEEDPNAEQDKKQVSHEPQTTFTENIFVGDKVGLKEKLKGYMHELNETAEEETGDIPKMYYENRKLHSFEVYRDTEKVQSVTFNYIVRLDEKTSWAEVMKEYEASGIDPTAENPSDGKKDEKGAKGGEDKSKKAPVVNSTLFKFEQVKSFQDKLPEEDPKAPAGTEPAPADPTKPKRYKFPDSKLMIRDVFKVLDAASIYLKFLDNKIFSIRAFYKDGRAHRMELNPNMSPEFAKKRKAKEAEIKAAEDALQKQKDEEARKEKDRKEREQRERRERRENKKNKEEFYKGPEAEQAPTEPVKLIEIPTLGIYDTQKVTWIPGRECNFAMGLISEENDLIALGLYKNHHESVKMHNPESLQEVPIHNFRDVLKHICKVQTKETDHYRVRHLKFKYTIEKFLEIGATVERKGDAEPKWYSDIQDEKARIKREAEEEEEKKRKEEEAARARMPAGMDPPKDAPKAADKKKDEEKTPEEIEDEKAHLFYVDFVHEDIARQRRIAEILERKALKDKTKGDDKGKGAKAPAPKGKDAPKDAKDPKKDAKKDPKDPKNKVEERKEDVIHTFDIDLKEVTQLRIDHKYGQVHKILFFYKDESVKTIEIPALTGEKGAAFMAMVEEENRKKEAEEKKKLDDYNRELKKHERAQKRKRIQARKNGEVFVETPFGKPKPEPKVYKDEEKRIIDQSIFYKNNLKPIEGFWAQFHPELKHFKFWGTEFKVKKTEAELKKEKEEAEKKQAEEEARKKKLAENPEEAKKEDPAAVAAQQRAAERREKEAHKLKDDFIRNYSLSRLGLKLIFFIDYHVPSDDPNKDKRTQTISEVKFKDELFKNNFDNVSKFLHDILPDSTIVANFRKNQAIGLFRVYTYGFGENPEQEREFFSNRHIKVAFPDIKKLYYDLIDEFVNYDDLKRLELRQKEELNRLGIVVVNPNDKKAATQGGAAGVGAAGATGAS